MGKGYAVPGGYRGFVNGLWMLFPTEREYVEYISEHDDTDCDQRSMADQNMLPLSGQHHRPGHVAS